MKFVILNEQSWKTAMSGVQKFAREHKRITIEVSPECKRSTAQNAYAFALYKLMGDHVGMEVGKMHAWAKLNIGINCFRSFECSKAGTRQLEYWDKYLSKLSYEQQFDYLETHEFKVTSCFTIEQMRAFLDELTSRVTAQGIKVPSAIDYGLSRDWNLL